MKLFFSVLIFILFQDYFGNAKNTNLIVLKKIKDTSVFTNLLKNKKLIAAGKEWDAQKYCNEETILNADQLEAYSLKSRGYELAFLCPGTLDGEENVVSVFSKTRAPKTRRVSPLKSSSRIDDQALEKTIMNLIKK